jgi:hypothetical protein
MLPASAHAERIVAVDFSSIDEVVAAFLDALERSDVAALHRLRVTESDYKHFLLAGHVPVGQPFRTYPPEFSDFAWQTLDTKSRYYERYLIEKYGGRRFALQDVRFEDGTEQHAGYSAHKQLRLTLFDGETPVELGTGSIVAVGGRYRFASFIRD